MTLDQLVDQTIATEGGFTDNPSDHGNATQFGITSGQWGRYQHLGRPASVREIQAITMDQARAFYRAQFLSSPFASVPFDEIKAQLLDIAVNSGPTEAIKLLQHALDVPVDGVMGDRTRQMLNAMPWKLTNAALVAQRVKFYLDLAHADANQGQFLKGWLARAVSFLA